MNKRHERIFLSTLLMIQIVIGVVILIFASILSNQISHHTQDILTQQAMSISEDKMRHRVESIIQYIEHENANAIQEVKSLGEFVTHSMTHVSEDELERHLTDWMPRLSRTKYGQAFYMLHHDLQTQAYTLFVNGQAADADALFGDSAAIDYIQSCPYYEIVSFEHTNLYIFATQQELDDVTKAFIYDLIQSSEYGSGEHVWINEILNYEGGDGYAVRFAHFEPSFRDGEYLNADDADADGNRPYLDELAALRSDGEYFHTYTEPGREDAVRTSSYVRLYQPFNWIIATGEPYDNILAYAQDMENYTDEIFSSIFRNIVILLLAALVAFIVFIIISSQKYSQAIQAQMEERLARNEQIFSTVAQHSDRMICYYDIHKRQARPWHDGDCKICKLTHICFQKHSLKMFEQGKGVHSGSRSDAARMVEEIHRGVPFGEANLLLEMPDGNQRWYEFKYSGLTSEGKPVAALLSYRDITEQHKREIAYRRYVQSLEFDAEGHLLHIECNLSADRVEKLSGQLFPPEEREIQTSYSDLGARVLRSKFEHLEKEKASRYFSRKNLLELYENGERQLQSQWQVRYMDDTLHWLAVETSLIDDPHNGNIKAFLRILDITEEHEQQQSLLLRADYDTMTGLLRRDVGESMIRSLLSAGKQPGGIFVALDLDDLKSINDTLGHAHGDKAIIGIATAMKSHFRKDDILIRAGGDEFIAFLPGAGESASSVELSLSSLLRKLSSISVGENGERTIHCSIGVAIELPGSDTFDSLYQRADMALYHVKRNGKNNYAFFEPAMLEDDYRFKTRQAQPVMTDLVKGRELQHLLNIVSDYYPGIVLFNLTQNYFHILTTGSNVDEIPETDRVDVFWQNWKNNIHPDDVESTISIISRNSLLAMYTQGKRNLRHYYRNLEVIGYVRTEINVHFYQTDTGDVCSFLFFRRSTSSAEELEIQRLQKILELSGTPDFEYICLINVTDRTYSVFSKDDDNSHAIPEFADFETVTRHIRDTCIAPEKRDDYYAKAALETVLQQMNAPEGQYSYEYEMTDNVMREAVFNWYEDSHTELLMTVRKLPPPQA